MIFTNLDRKIMRMCLNTHCLKKDTSKKKKKKLNFFFFFFFFFWGKLKKKKKKGFAQKYQTKSNFRSFWE